MSFDFPMIFRDQIAKVKPFTEGNVRQMLALLSMNLKTKELVARSKHLKSKVGVKRLTYQITDYAKTTRHAETWTDEFDSLQEILEDFEHVGYNGDMPIFELKKQ